MTPTRSLVESSLLVGLAVVLFLAAQFLPVVGIVFSFLCPAPLVVMGLRHDIKKALLGVAVATGLITIFMGPIGALFFILGFGVLGVGLGILAKRFTRGVEIILYGILLSLGSKLLLMVIASKVMGVNPFSIDPVEVETMFNKIFAFYAGKGLSPETIESMKQQVMMSLKIIPLVFPALLTLAASVDCYLSYVISSAVIRRVGSGVLPPLPPFSNWRFPKSIFWALLVSMVFSMVGMQQGQTSLLFRMGMNLKLLVNIIFLLQGLSVIWYYLSLKGIGAVVKWIALLLIVFIPFLSNVSLILGVADMWFDFRSRIRRE
ncbi:MULTISPECIES: YybS family protein [Aminobacterium]|uniref:DUF2232 domain-containing protein n=1 Tax=Aminobacterium colombiense (strain DSM 12261 / ALA-1) TaxID=572547 RepID=D5EG54_AMICL|nr:MULTISPECIES: DUF2232 domain-containing protein [Aminobacterium]MDD2378940.1 DUF2232 domain-containing protein [Aminobacterium colombiense]ADE57536.1 Protein of unknown function DUF2232, membrane [Aminobacterium colombiense DSM 12261]MDD3768828.1 DUF2232 domain-containing protein [Aminobacterium colombiense]MDD4265139.1 DUF2232 domain-containing protein [Aminobacterium colombiense]MDD4585680.1 DUF2232 domain-containing protein [Aminobacterium colombiense]